MLARKLMGAAGGAESQLYVDDVFSTYLYTGNGSTQTITNGIDLAGEGGLVWIKSRSDAGTSHNLFDTLRGVTKRLYTNVTNAEGTGSDTLTGFNSNGFVVSNNGETNESPRTYASWTFRKAAKFFDVVTWTGNGVANRQIAHSLGIAPGMIIVKRTDASANWLVYHRTQGRDKYGMLNTTFEFFAYSGIWGNADPSDTIFTCSSDGNNTNVNGATYVAYLFAHDTATDGIIQCGSYVGNGGVQSVSLGWEPQYVLIKSASSAQTWLIFDTMRGLPTGGSDRFLQPNSSAAEDAGWDALDVTATGFTLKNGDGATNLTGTYIYLAIRRPNKPPTSGTEVYNATSSAGTDTTNNITGVGFASDLILHKGRSNGGDSHAFTTRLLGNDRFLRSNLTSGESVEAGTVNFSTSSGMDGITVGTGLSQINDNIYTYIRNFFRRAPGFFDVVCYTGTGANLNVAHGLGIAPEMVIVKSRSNPLGWYTCFNFTNSTYDQNTLNTTSMANISVAYGAGGDHFSSKPTASILPLGAGAGANALSYTYVAYLFATLAGISKVGSYTGNGSSQTINCGFSAGARFILIKRTDNTGDWYVWDSVRGIVAANDPHLSLNTDAAEVTTDDSVDPDNSGFIVNQVAATNINVTSATYIFLAVS